MSTCRCKEYNIECFCGTKCWYCQKDNPFTIDTRNRCFDCGMSFNAAEDYKQENLIDLIIEMANKIYEDTKKRSNMKNCFGCRQNLPLGSGRFHYSTDKDGNMINTPCTHNPHTNKPYNLACRCSPSYVCSDCIVTSKPQMSGSAKTLMFGIANKKCECGAEKCGFQMHSDYCPKFSKEI